jgi:predicted transglutaminase-like cysteine proteinase
MLSRLFGFITAAAIFGLAWNTFGEASEHAFPRASREPIGGEASIPYGWVDFCHRHSEECTLGKLKPMDVRLTRQTWKTLSDINDEVNNAIEPVSNLDHWGTTLDHWDYPVDGKGDCKIYALDNLSQDVRPWSATGYQFYKRQAQDDPNIWLSLGGVTGTEPATAAANAR